MTTRGFSEAYLVAGTNRAPVRFAMLNFMCMDQEDLRDITAHADRVRKDVTRSPGGDSQHFLERLLDLPCGSRRAGRRVRVLRLRRRHCSKRSTRLATCSRSSTRMRACFRSVLRRRTILGSTTGEPGSNEFVGWNAAGGGEGNGAKSLGHGIGSDTAVRRVPDEASFRTGLLPVAERHGRRSRPCENIADIFEANNRSMKRVFAETALYCMGT